MSVEDYNHQEWTFTLYAFDNSGRVTKEVHLYLSLLPRMLWCFKLRMLPFVRQAMGGRTGSKYIINFLFTFFIHECSLSYKHTFLL